MKVPNTRSDKDFPSHLIPRTAFYGRTFEEYKRMFNLNIEELKNLRILDCPSGPSSFVSESYRKKINVVGCDPMYRYKLNYLLKTGLEDIEMLLEKVASYSHKYNWNFYKSLHHLKKFRKLALNRFSKDFVSGIKAGRYHIASLPFLPFKDNTFDITFSANLLFLYDNLYDLDFHLTSILELMRVTSKEIRIFPIQGSDFAISRIFLPIVHLLVRHNLACRIENVEHHFQTGANKMMIITKDYD